MDPDKNSIMTLTPITQAKPEDTKQRNQYWSGIYNRFMWNPFPYSMTSDTWPQLEISFVAHTYPPVQS